jgi:hypothetical protein
MTRNTPTHTVEKGGQSDSPSHSKVFDKVMGAVNRAQYDRTIFTPAQFRYVTSEFRRARLTGILRDCGISFPKGNEGHFISEVQWALSELILDRRRNRDKAPIEVALLVRLRKASEDFVEAHRAIRTNEELYGSLTKIMNEFLVTTITQMIKYKMHHAMVKKAVSEVNSFFEFLDTPELAAIMHRVWSDYFSIVIKDFEETKRVDTAEYKFMMHVMEAWYLQTNVIPTLSRNKYASTTQREKRSPIRLSRLFEPFIKAIVPEIGDGTIRDAVDTFREAVKAANRPGEGMPKKTVL